jgi:LysM repeat protein/proteasome lid subunit RPN8/RPN11
MEKDFDIELQGNSTEEQGHMQLPLNFITFGEIEHDDVKVYIKQDVYKALEKYALADTEHERGTIILGDYHEELGKMHVIISNYIEARYTDASASTLTFTHETWDYVYKEQNEKYPDKKIVGWQHTHPSYGIFLSNYDLFIQENFFNLPFQVAYVIDPIQDIRGFFQWKNGKIEKLKGYYIYDDIGKPIKIEQTRKERNKHDVKKHGALFPMLSIIAAIVAVISFVFMLNMRSMLLKQDDMRLELEQTVQEQESRINAFEQEETENGDVFTAEELLDKIESQQIVLDNQQEIIDELSETVAKLQLGQTVVDDYVVYTVKTGDTLAGICKEIGLDYHANRNTILSLNHIADENIIYTGQVLIFPNGNQ